MLKFESFTFPSVNNQHIKGNEVIARTLDALLGPKDVVLGTSTGITEWLIEYGHHKILSEQELESLPSSDGLTIAVYNNQFLIKNLDNLFGPCVFIVENTRNVSDFHNLGIEIIEPSLENAIKMLIFAFTISFKTKKPVIYHIGDHLIKHEYGQKDLIRLELDANMHFKDFNQRLQFVDSALSTDSEDKNRQISIPFDESHLEVSSNSLSNKLIIASGRLWDIMRTLTTDILIDCLEINAPKMMNETALAKILSRYEQILILEHRGLCIEDKIREIIDNYHLNAKIFDQLDKVLTFENQLNEIRKKINAFISNKSADLSRPN